MDLKVSLPDDIAKFVESAVSAGRYSSSGEVVHEALRLMERVEKADLRKLNVLRRAYKEGLESGDAGELDFTAIKREARERLSALKA